jgi:hypothetical protein
LAVASIQAQAVVTERCEADAPDPSGSAFLYYNVGASSKFGIVEDIGVDRPGGWDSKPVPIRVDSLE